MKRILAWMLMICLLLLCGCAKIDEAETADALREIDVVLDWYPNALHAFLYVAEEKGYFADEGLKVNIRFPSNANDAISLVAAGQAEIGMYYQQDVIQARANQNIPVKSIGAVVQSPLNVVLFMQDQKIETPADLQGKTVGYAGTELSEAIMRCMMEHVGANYDAVKMVDVGFDLMSAMTTGNVDATIGSNLNHEYPQLVEEGFDVDYLRLEDYGVPSYYEMLFLASDHMIANEPDVLRAFLRACDRGFDDVQADPAAALDVLLQNQNAENFPLSETVEKSSLDMLLPIMESADTPFLGQKDACWQENIDWMLAQGLIEKSVELDDIRADLGL